jgi:MFS family permease
MSVMTEEILVAPIDEQQALDRGFSPYQSLIVALLALVQFTIIIDFMIMSPLGAIIMPALNITAAQFGVAVSAYAFSAAISGILAAGFADRFDRKRLLLFFYVGFTLGTALCAVAPNYHVLLVGRVVTGLFGGVMGSIVLAIITDLFALHLRGALCRPRSPQVRCWASRSGFFCPTTGTGMSVSRRWSACRSSRWLPS